MFKGTFKYNQIYQKNAKIYNIMGNLLYEGDVLKNKRDGYGIMYHNNKKIHYQCNFKSNITFFMNKAFLGKSFIQIFF